VEPANALRPDLRTRRAAGGSSPGRFGTSPRRAIARSLRSTPAVTRERRSTAIFSQRYSECGAERSSITFGWYPRKDAGDMSEKADARANKNDVARGIYDSGARGPWPHLRLRRCTQGWMAAGSPEGDIDSNPRYEILESHILSGPPLLTQRDRITPVLARHERHDRCSRNWKPAAGTAMSIIYRTRTRHDRSQDRVKTAAVRHGAS
jgi:hypothetical protein